VYYTYFRAELIVDDGHEISTFQYGLLPIVSLHPHNTLYTVLKPVYIMYDPGAYFGGRREVKGIRLKTYQ